MDAAPAVPQVAGERLANDAIFQCTDAHSSGAAQPAAAAHSELEARQVGTSIDRISDRALAGNSEAIKPSMQDESLLSQAALANAAQHMAAIMYSACGGTVINR